MLQKPVIFAIKIYRYCLSFMCWGVCRYYPTCSSYALQSVESFGVWRGLWLSVRRLGRCHPWCHGGYDPVPDKHS